MRNLAAIVWIVLIAAPLAADRVTLRAVFRSFFEDDLEVRLETGITLLEVHPELWKRQFRELFELLIYPGDRVELLIEGERVVNFRRLEVRDESPRSLAEIATPSSPDALPALAGSLSEERLEPLRPAAASVWTTEPGDREREPEVHTSRWVLWNRWNP